MKRVLILILLLLSFLMLTGAGLSATNNVDMSWWTVDGGGAVPSLSGGSYSLQGTVGQADAGVLSSGGYTLYGGFWNPNISSATQTVYLPFVHKQ